MIAQSQAENVFGDEPAVGKQLTADKLSFVVGGVYKDFPQNSVIQNAVYRRIGEKENQDNWNANGYQLYVLLDDPGKKDQIIADFKNHFNHEYYDWKTKECETDPTDPIFIMRQMPVLIHRKTKVIKRWCSCYLPSLY